MFCVHSFAALLSILVSAEPEAFSTVRHQAPYRSNVTIERDGLPTIIVGGSNEILARNDLVGTWQVTQFEQEGKSLSDLAAGLQMKFYRGRIELLQRDREPINVSFDIDLHGVPPRFEWTLPCASMVTRQKGVYWLEGDRLMICLGALNAEGVSEFLTQPGDGRSLFVLRREKPVGEGTSLSHPQ